MSLPPGSEGSQPAPKTPQKPPNFWALASVTYGVVIAFAIVSVVAYYYLAPKAPYRSRATRQRSVAVGSVWMPVYPGATVESTASTKQEGVTESTLSFETKDPAGRVLSFYQSALRKGVFRFDTVTKECRWRHRSKPGSRREDERAGDGPATGGRFPGRNPDHRYEIRGDKDTRN